MHIGEWEGTFKNGPLESGERETLILPCEDFFAREKNILN